MTFLWPSMLSLMLLLPLLAGLYVYMQRRRRQKLAAYGSFALPQSGSGRGPGVRKHISSALFLLSLSAMTFALARPQSTVNLPSVEGTVILVFDVSGSMAANDIQPTRMEAAKSAAVGFVQQQPPGVQVGVVAFSDGGLSIVSPTNRQDKVVDAINRLSPQRGTSLANGILTALNLIARDNPEVAASAGAETPAPVPQGAGASAVIVLLTDGENNMGPNPMEAVQAAAEAGVRIDTIGVGSPEGVTITVNNFVVHTQLDEAALKQIAGVTRGTYFNARTESDLQKIYAGIRPQFVIKPEQIEVTAVFAAVAMAVLLVGAGLSLLWFGRVP